MGVRIPSPSQTQSATLEEKQLLLYLFWNLPEVLPWSWGGRQALAALQRKLTAGSHLPAQNRDLAPWAWVRMVPRNGVTGQ